MFAKLICPQTFFYRHILNKLEYIPFQRRPIRRNFRVADSRWEMVVGAHALEL